MIANKQPLYQVNTVAFSGGVLLRQIHLISADSIQGAVVAALELYPDTVARVVKVRKLERRTPSLSTLEQGIKEGVFRVS